MRYDAQARKRDSRLFLGFLDARLRGHDEWVEGVVVLATDPLVKLIRKGACQASIP